MAMLDYWRVSLQSWLVLNPNPSVSTSLLFQQFAHEKIKRPPQRKGSKDLGIYTFNSKPAFQSPFWKTIKWSYMFAIFHPPVFFPENTLPEI